MLSKSKLVEGITLLCEIYEREATELLFRGYHKALESMSDEQFENAIVQLMQTKKFSKLPLPGEIIEAVTSNPEHQALIALAKVEKAMSDYGGGYSVVFDDLVIHRVINAIPGGWIGMCEMFRDELKFVLKDFLKMYVAFQGRDEMDTPMKLYGRHDLNNEQMGYIASGKAPEYIGYVVDKAKALEWTSQAKAQLDGNAKLKQL